MNEIENIINRNQITGEGLFYYNTTDKKTFADKLKMYPIDPQSVKLCRKWLRCFAVKGKKADKNSYDLKHEVEVFYGGYIEHGAFIVAGLLEGYSMKKDGSPNCQFNMGFHVTSNRLVPFYIPVIPFNTYKDVVKLLDPNTELIEE